MLIGWVATHTGLPAFYATGNGQIVADFPVPRLIARVEGEVLVADVGAPAGTAVTYRFGSDTVTLTRVTRPGETASHQFLTDSSGSTVAGVRLLGDDPREYDTKAQIFTSALGRQIPRYPLGGPPPTGSIEVASTGAGTQVLRDFTRAKAPLWVIHDAAYCQLPGCDIEGARLVVPHRIREVRSRRRDVAERVWEITYSRVPDELAGVAGTIMSAGPVVTWGQWADWGSGHPAEVGWRAWSALEVARRVAGMPAV